MRPADTLLKYMSGDLKRISENWCIFAKDMLRHPITQSHDAAAAHHPALTAAADARRDSSEQNNTKHYKS